MTLMVAYEERAEYIVVVTFSRSEAANMRISKDEEFNLLYVGFKDRTEDGEVATTREFLPGAYFDLDANGKLLGIEIVNTKNVLGIPASELRLPEETLKQ